MAQKDIKKNQTVMQETLWDLKSWWHDLKGNRNPKEEACCTKILQIQNQLTGKRNCLQFFRLKNQIKKPKNSNLTQNQKTTTPRKTYLTTVILVILEIINN